MKIELKTLLKNSRFRIVGILIYSLIFLNALHSETPRSEWSLRKSPAILKEWSSRHFAEDPLLNSRNAETSRESEIVSLTQIPKTDSPENYFSVYSHTIRCSSSAGQSGECPYRVAVYLPFCPSGCILLREGSVLESDINLYKRQKQNVSRPRIVPIEAFNEEEHLDLVLSPFAGPRSLRENPILGTFEEIQSVFLLKATRVLFFTSLELFSFVFFIFIYLRRRQDKFNLSFSILNLSLALWYPSYEGWSLYVLDSPWTYIFFGYSVGAFLPILFHEFTRGIFQSPRDKIGTALEIVFFIHSLWPSLEYGLTGGLFLFSRYAFDTFIAVLVLFFIYTTYIFVQYRKTSILSFRWVVSGLVLVATSSFYTVLSFAGIGNAGTWVNESFLGLTLLFSLALAKRYAEVFRALENSQSKLQILNESLESKVEERTRIIELQKTELEQKGKILAKDLSIAGKIQSSLLPRELPVIPHASMAYRYRPMMEVGGDLLDVLYDPKSSTLGMFIGDVTGHGVSAALLASMVKMTLGTWANYLQDPSALLQHIRQQLEGKLDGHFLTATFITVDLRTGHALIANAGHPECLILRKNGQIEFYRPKGVAIYESIPADYQTEVVPLNPGDKVVLYTDGIPDARNSEGDLLGEEYLAEILKQNANLTPEHLCDAVMKAVQAYQGENYSYQHQDDMALLVAEYIG
ncbi:serine/threonine protein phosphatase [Leptospira inadai serovar Lyme]|uniref:Serine/threonine protein phosphatase n=1 Tax=Leptospira inadai serovar Lyme TaxID=293084 RepID=A0ABX4YDH9_9LEPT|nr:serine/threonine protein phosphatase [Leptospira inadai serovar Lyme]